MKYKTLSIFLLVNLIVFSSMSALSSQDDISIISKNQKRSEAFSAYFKAASEIDEFYNSNFKSSSKSVFVAFVLGSFRRDTGEYSKHKFFLLLIKPEYVKEGAVSCSVQQDNNSEILFVISRNIIYEGLRSATLFDSSFGKVTPKQNLETLGLPICLFKKTKENISEERGVEPNSNKEQYLHCREKCSDLFEKGRLGQGATIEDCIKASCK